MTKPMIPQIRVDAVLAKHGFDIEKEQVMVLGVRGYFRQTMGVPGQNDIGIYDDALIWVYIGGYQSFNANVDPSRHYKNVATLNPGIWKYQKGLHGFGRNNPPYPAFRQAAPVTVTRYVDGRVSKQDTGIFAINIHRGGVNRTSSAGCQTVPPSQWQDFKKLGYDLLDKYKKKTFTYLLVENDGSIA